MHIMWFTERAYHHVPEDEVLKLRSFFGVPNRFFDPQKGAQLLNQYLDEKIYSDELGTFDGFWQCQILDTRVPALPSR